MIRPYRIHSEPQLAEATRIIGEAIARWSEAWLGNPAAATLDAIEPADWLALASDPKDWTARGSELEWCAADPIDLEALARAVLSAGEEDLTHEGRPSALGRAVALRSLAGLLDEILAGDDVDARPADWARSAAEPGAGTCMARVHAADASIELLLSGMLVHRLAPPGRKEIPGAPLHASTDWIESLRAQARCVTRTTRIDLAELGSIQVGDVIRLEQSLDAPARLVFDALSLECQAYLCQRDGRRAVLVRSNNEANSPEPGAAQ